MNHKKAIPVLATAQGKICPVCGHTTYSRGGVHPQCSFFRADAKLSKRRRKPPRP